MVVVELVSANKCSFLFRSFSFFFFHSFLRANKLWPTTSMGLTSLRFVLVVLSLVGYHFPKSHPLRVKCVFRKVFRYNLFSDHSEWHLHEHGLRILCSSHGGPSRLRISHSEIYVFSQSPTAFYDFLQSVLKSEFVISWNLVPFYGVSTPQQ